MNIQDILTYLLDVIAFGYVALILLDLGNCLCGELLDTFYPTTAPPLGFEPATTKSILRMPAKPAATVLKQSVQQVEVAEPIVVEDP